MTALIQKLDSYLLAVFLAMTCGTIVNLVVIWGRV